MKIRILSLAFLLSLFSALADGKFQIHFMDVGQGDGALLISPGGETVLFDTGVRNDCDRPLSYLQQLGIRKIDYLIVSHYHDDHLGCAVALLQEYPLQKASIDRGETYQSRTFNNYVAFVGNKRETAIEDSAIYLDAGSRNPVKIEFTAFNGNGIKTKDENDKSLVCVVRYGQFDAVMGGDLSGYNTSKYKDIETSIASKVGQVELYKVNHHGSQYSSNPTWLNTINPMISIVSCGNGNEYGHPTRDAINRLHQVNTKTYWTERGNGVPASGDDKIGGNIIVEVDPNSIDFRVKYGTSGVDSYKVWRPITPTVVTDSQYAWSKRATVYHYAQCKYVKNISADNLETGAAPPPNKELHLGCPK